MQYEIIAWCNCLFVQDILPIHDHICARGLGQMFESCFQNSFVLFQEYLLFPSTNMQVYNPTEFD